MDKVELQKNILDLRYHSESQKINAILVICSVGILAFIGTFIWYRERIAYGSMISLMVILISILFYIKTKRRVQGILNKIEKL